MLHRVVVDIVDVTGKVVFVAKLTRPKSTLPGNLSDLCCRADNRQGRQGQGETLVRIL